MEKCSLYLPGYEDLWFKQQMLSDEETMSYNHAWGGTVPFPEEKWRAWYDRWIVHHENKRYYRYLKDKAGTFVGELSYHYDGEKDVCMADIVVYAKYRGKGYGAQALDMLCSAAKENGIDVLYDEIAADNPSIGLFIKHGFSEAYRTEKTVVLKKNL